MLSLIIHKSTEERIDEDKWERRYLLQREIHHREETVSRSVINDLWLGRFTLLPLLVVGFAGGVYRPS